MKCLSDDDIKKLLSDGKLPGFLSQLLPRCPVEDQVVLERALEKDPSLLTLMASALLCSALDGNKDVAELQGNANRNLGYLIAGADAGDQSAVSVAVGDINGDGIPDIVIGATGAKKDVGGDDNEGETYVIYGQSGTSRTNIDLADLKNNANSALGFIIHGKDANDASGHDVAIGDVNGDGISDIIIGAPNAKKDVGGDDSEGETYVIYGQSGTSRTNIDLADLKNNADSGVGFIIHGADQDDQSGVAVTTGDFNGDGIPDIIIGAKGAKKDVGGHDNEGETYVIYGQSGTSRTNIDLADLKNNADSGVGFIIHGSDQGDASSLISVATGDVNGDGKADIIIGTPASRKDTGGSTDEGQTYVIYGQTGTSYLNIDLADLKNNADSGVGFIIHGNHGEESSGMSVAAADVNKDGIPDIIIGAAGGGSIGKGAYHGRTYVVYGQSGTSRPNLDLFDLANNANRNIGFSIEGMDALDRSGIKVSTGDVNKDGIPDIIIGAYTASKDSGGASNEGQVYIVYSKQGTRNNLDLADLKNNLNKDLGFVIHGNAANDFFGFSIATGDVNNDGIVDIVAGSAAANGGTGETNVIYGQACEVE